MTEIDIDGKSYSIGKTLGTLYKHLRDQGVSQGGADYIMKEIMYRACGNHSTSGPQKKVEEVIKDLTA